MNKPLCPYLVSGIISCMGSFTPTGGKRQSRAFLNDGAKLDDGERFHSINTPCMFRLNGQCYDPSTHLARSEKSE